MARANSTSPLAIVSRDQVRPPTQEGTSVRLIRVAPNGKRIAWVGDDGVGAAIFVAKIGGEPARVLSLGADAVDDLGWSHKGDHLAYVVGGQLPTGIERSVGWARPEVDGELGRVDGAAYGWSGTGRSLYVADLRRQSLVSIELANHKELILSSLADDGDLRYPPVVAVAPNGRHVAFTCRRASQDLSELWVLGRDADGAAANLLTQIPGARARIFPFWSPKGRSLGMHVVHFDLGMSALIVVRHLQGEGEIFHHHELIDAPLAPAWRGGLIAWWLATGVGRMGALGPQTLALLDSRTRSHHVLASTGLSFGTPRFLADGRLVLDGGTTAELLKLG